MLVFEFSNDYPRRHVFWWTPSKKSNGVHWQDLGDNWRRQNEKLRILEIVRAIKSKSVELCGLCTVLLKPHIVISNKFGPKTPPDHNALPTLTFFVCIGRVNSNAKYAIMSHMIDPIAEKSGIDKLGLSGTLSLSEAKFSVLRSLWLCTGLTTSATLPISSNFLPFPCAVSRIWRS